MGIPNPITIRDPGFQDGSGPCQRHVCGAVADPAIFLQEVIGTDSNVNVDGISELLRRIIAQAFSDMILQTGNRRDRPPGQGR